MVMRAIGTVFMPDIGLADTEVSRNQAKTRMCNPFPPMGLVEEQQELCCNSPSDSIPHSSCAPAALHQPPAEPQVWGLCSLPTEDGLRPL